MTASAAGVRLAALRLVAAALVVAGLAGGCAPGPSPSALAQASPAPVDYRLSFPAPAHRWLAAEVRFDDVGASPLHVRMSSASPGRYARHEFAKNLIEIAFTNADGDPAAVERRGPAHWVVSGHGGGVQVRYRLFGDRVDGTYLAVDATHAHMNMPATLLWAEGLEDRPARVTLRPPAGAEWRAATQLYPTADPLVFTAPNLAYLLDSPIELSDFALRTFTVADPADPGYRPAFRVAVHHAGRASAVDGYAEAVERIVRETVPIFGEFPRFETGAYTFIADYLPSASGDAMEHRNSTVLTANATLDRDRTWLLGSVSHEFFHAWNVERIRPRSLEPFDFTRANVSGALWLAEGFTNYYGALVLQRAGLATLGATLDRFARVIGTVARGPGRQFRSVVEMSRMAPFTDAATAIDPTNFANTFISYYVWGEAIGLGLDLTLRSRSGGRVTLDDYMRALWERFGAPDGEPGAGVPPGVVTRPYTPADAEAVLGEVAGDAGVRARCSSPATSTAGRWSTTPRSSRRPASSPAPSRPAAARSGSSRSGAAGASPARPPTGRRSTRRASPRATSSSRWTGAASPRPRPSNGCSAASAPATGCGSSSAARAARGKRRRRWRPTRASSWCRRRRRAARSPPSQRAFREAWLGSRQ